MVLRHNYSVYYVITILSPPVSGPDQPQAGLRQGGHLTHRHEPFHTVYEERKLRYIKQFCTMYSLSLFRVP